MMRTLSSLCAAFLLAAGLHAQQATDVATPAGGAWLPTSADLSLQVKAPAPQRLPGGGLRATSACDDFNRANSTNMGADWTEIIGDYEVLNNQCTTVTGGLDWMLHNTAADAYGAQVIEFDLDPNVSGSSAYVAAVLGYSPVSGEDVFVKVQNQSGLPGYSNFGFYHGNNGGAYGAWGGFGTLPWQITGGHVWVYVDAAGDNINLDIDENYDGIVDIALDASGLVASGLPSLLGTGAGVGTWSAGTLDNWGFGGGCAGSGVFEIPAMTVPHSFIDMDMVGPAGPTSLAALNAAGTNGGANIANFTFLPSTAVQGVYNTNPNGRALGMLAGGMVLVDPPTGVFDAFNAAIDLGQVSTEIGIGVGDWLGPMQLDFFLGGVLVAQHVSSPYSTTLQTIYFQFPGGFDRVEIIEPIGSGNWVIPELYIEKTLPTLTVTNLVAGQTAHVMVTNATPFGMVRSAYSLIGGGPVGTPFGLLYLTPPYNELPRLTADVTGTTNYFGNVPAGTTGRMVWVHAIDMASQTFTNPFAGVIG
jgi:hypothetical protein